MKVLFIEDRGSVSEPIIKGLVEEGFGIVHAISIADATFKLSEAQYDAMILDVNMDSKDLEEIAKIKVNDINTIITGWYWLKYYVYPNYTYIINKVIIFSDYIDQLCEPYVSQKDLVGIPLLEKRKYTDPIKILTNSIREIEKNINK